MHVTHVYIDRAGGAHCNCIDANHSRPAQNDSRKMSSVDRYTESRTHARAHPAESTDGGLAFDAPGRKTFETHPHRR